MKLFSLGPAFFLPSVYSWGGLGHETVAFVASSFVQQDTEVFFQKLLNSSTSAYLAGVATWADSYRYSHDGRFSAPLHFIDAQDDPPNACGVRFTRDCGEKGCVVSAIANYTSRLLNPSMDEESRIVAAKFIIHFVGDIHQPLHTENLDRGGNGIHVRFGSAHTNLHHVWDTSIPEKLVGGYALADAERWAANISQAIRTGTYRSAARGWLAGMNLADPVSMSLAWATESNALMCKTVLPEGVAGVEDQDLSGEYYETAIPVVQLQVARAGYRLAHWLDLIAAGDQAEL